MGYVVNMGKMINPENIFVLLSGLKLKYEDNIKWDFKEPGCMGIVSVWLRIGDNFRALVDAPYDISHEGNLGCDKRR
jgi:hypothetical protein